MDVTCSTSVKAGFDAAEKALGVDRGGIDIVVNCAGVSGMPRTFITVKEDDFDRVMDTNLKGTFLVAQEGAKRMKLARRRGAIVNVASILGLGCARESLHTHPARQACCT